MYVGFSFNKLDFFCNHRNGYRLGMIQRNVVIGNLKQCAF